MAECGSRAFESAAHLMATVASSPLLSASPGPRCQLLRRRRRAKPSGPLHARHGGSPWSARTAPARASSSASEAPAGPLSQRLPYLLMPSGKMAVPAFLYLALNTLGFGSLRRSLACLAHPSTASVEPLQMPMPFLPFNSMEKAREAGREHDKAAHRPAAPLKPFVVGPGGCFLSF